MNKILVSCILLVLLFISACNTQTSQDGRSCDELGFGDIILTPYSPTVSNLECAKTSISQDHIVIENICESEIITVCTFSI